MLKCCMALVGEVGERGSGERWGRESEQAAYPTQTYAMSLSLYSLQQPRTTPPYHPPHLRLPTRPSPFFTPNWNAALGIVSCCNLYLSYSS